MELIIVLILLVIVTYIFKKFNSLVYSVAIIDIFFRIIHFLKSNIASPELYNLVGNNIPESLPSLINKYTTGVFNEILIWIYVINFIILEVYLVKKLIKK